MGEQAEAARAARWRRPSVAIPCALAVVVLLFYAPVVFAGRVFFLKDAQLVVYPIRLALRRRLLQLDVPEWLPELDLGLPFVADPANGVLYPLNALLLLPAPWSVGLFIVLHAVIAAAGSWWLLRTLRVSRAASVVGALGFALGGYMVSLTWISNYMMSLAWLPLVSLAALGTMRTGKLGYVAATGATLALQVLSGEPQGVFLTGWFVLALAFTYPLPHPLRWRRVALLCVSLAIAACIAMPQILPTLELLPRSRRASGIDLPQALHWSLHPLRLVELVAPWIYGNPIDFDEFLGFFMNDEGGPFHRDPWIATPYFGSVAVVFVVLAAVWGRTRHRWWVRSLLVLSAFVVLLALGRHTPVFAVYFETVPGARLFRYPAKFYGLVSVTLPFIAAAGIDAWTSSRRLQRPFLVGVVVLVTALAALLGASGAIGEELAALRESVAEDSATWTVRSALLWEIALVVVVAAALVVCRRAAPRWVPAAVVGGLTLQLLAVNVRAYETADGGVFSGVPELARKVLSTTPEGNVPRVLHGLPAVNVNSFDSLPGDERARHLAEALMMNVGIAHGVGYAQAYTSADEGEKRHLWEEAAAWRRALMDTYGVGHVVLPSDVAVDAASGLERVLELESVGAAAYLNRRALPFAYVASDAVPARDVREALHSLRSPLVSGGVVASVEGLEGPGPTRPPESRQVTACRLLAVPSDDVRVACESRQPGWVVVNASHHPNWQARVGGQSVPVHRANAMVMAVPIPAGAHEIELSYREPSLPIGLAAGAFVALLCVLLVVRDASGSPRRSSSSQRRPVPGD